MTSSRFQSIGAILAKTAEGQPVELSDTQTAEADACSGTVSQLAPTQTNQTKRAARPATTMATRRPSASQASTGGVRRVAFRLAPDLYERLAAAATTRKSSHGQIVLDAVEAAAMNPDNLASLVAEPAAATSGLFPRLPQRPPAEASIPAEIRIDARAVDILDQLVTQSGARNRTHLITAALQSYL